MGIGFKGRIKKGKETAKESSKQTSAGRWKHCIHSESGQVYYYHTKTKETTWVKPDSFQLWKVVKDTSSGRSYFYNRITRETTWDKPSDFEEWRTAVDKTSGNTYYYNAITQETTWSDPRSLKKEPDPVQPFSHQDASAEVSEIEGSDSFAPHQLFTFVILHGSCEIWRCR